MIQRRVGPFLSFPHVPNLCASVTLVRSGSGRTRPESHLGVGSACCQVASSQPLCSHPSLLMLAYPLLPRMGRRCFPRRTSSAHSAGSGKMRSGPPTSIGQLTSKVGGTWNPVSPILASSQGVLVRTAECRHLGLGPSWVSPHCRLQARSQWSLVSL